jgi:hypothetical protein
VVHSPQLRETTGPDLEKMSFPIEASKKSKRGPSVPTFGEASLRAQEDNKLRAQYDSYVAWCGRMRLPIAEFQIWRATTAHIPNA